MGLFGRMARGLSRWVPPAALAHAGRPAALFFHGVEAATDDERVQTNHHEITGFRAILRGLKDFDVLPLTALDDVLAHPQRHRRSLFLMSDDGYRNTLTVAADILDEFRMPWTLFISTAHIGTGKPNPIFLARLFFFYAPSASYSLPHFPVIRLDSAESRAKSALSSIEKLRFLPAEQAEETLTAMKAAFAPEVLNDLVERFASEKFLTWDEVRRLAARGVTIGAHGDSHWPMHDRQSSSWLAQQAMGAKAHIEAEVGPCRFFAYPFGNTRDVGPAAWKAVRDAGFHYGFTTLAGSLPGGRNPFLLPRYGLGPRDSHIASLVPFLPAGNRRVRAWQAALG
ncbi:MAG: polysaccharide deacetylase family protein [Alphaproteobacteria bacterium]|nr:polysaccharide deacetylase family protein [Alphaproteobacteria bacterium]